MCGARVRLLGLDEHPTLGEHLDAVVDEALQQLQGGVVRAGATGYRLTGEPGGSGHRREQDPRGDLTAAPPSARGRRCGEPLKNRAPAQRLVAAADWTGTMSGPLGVSRTPRARFYRSLQRLL